MLEIVQLLFLDAKFKYQLFNQTMFSFQCQIKGVAFSLMTSHLESTKDFAEERKEQLRRCFEEIKAQPATHNVLFGGDLNLRDKEVLVLCLYLIIGTEMSSSECTVDYALCYGMKRNQPWFPIM